MDTWRGCFRGFRVFDFLPNVFELTMLAPSRKAISGQPGVLPTSPGPGAESGARVRRRPGATALLLAEMNQKWVGWAVVSRPGRAAESASAVWLPGSIAD